MFPLHGHSTGNAATLSIRQNPLFNDPRHCVCIEEIGHARSALPALQGDDREPFRGYIIVANPHYRFLAALRTSFNLREYRRWR